MAQAVTWDDLRELAGVEAERGFAVSLYLDLAPSLAPTPRDAQTRLHSLIDGAAKLNGAQSSDLPHDRRLGLRQDLERIRAWFEHEFERDGAHGLALYCAGLDGIWRTLQLAEPVPDGVKLGRELSLAPLVPLVGRGEGALVLAVSREQGRFYRLRAGRLEELADLTEEQPRRHDQGGWAQARLQRHVDELAQEHLRRVAAELDRLVRSLSTPDVVVVAADELWAEFADLLATDARAAVAGVVQAESHAPPPALLAAAAPVLERRRAEREDAVAERWLEERGRNGRAAGGWKETLTAASDGRVDVLLYAEGANRLVRRCPACGHLAAAGGDCPLDGTPLAESGDGLDLAVHLTLSRGGTARALAHRRDLDPVEGIGALLRF